MKHLFLMTCIAFSFVGSASADIQLMEESTFPNSNILEMSTTCVPPVCQPPAAQDKFGQLESLYAQGTAPLSTDELVGWTSGRCFHASDRNTAKNVLLIGFVDTIGGNDGPLFPSKEIFKGFVGWYNNGTPADYFDQLSTEKENIVMSLISSERSNALEACSEQDALVMGTSSLGPIWKLRKSQGYLVLEHFQNKKVQAYCYFYKKVR